MKLPSKYALLVWPVYGALLGCSTDQQLGRAAGGDAGYVSGAGAEAQGNGGDAGGATGGTSTHSTGGRDTATGGAAGAARTGDPGGGDPVGQAGQATGGGGPDERKGLPGVDSFTKLTIRSSGGMPWMPDAESTCDTSYDDAFAVDRASRTLSWDYCGTAEGSSASTPQSGHRTLSDAEFQAVLNTLSLVAPSTREGCGYDKPAVTLELEVDGSSTLYTDDFYKCDNDPSSKNYVAAIDPLDYWLRELARGLEIPTTPDTLSVSTDKVLDPAPPTDSECASYYRPLYDLDRATGELSWKYCTAPADSGAFTLMTGSRVLDDAELQSVLRAYGDLELGASGPCDSLSVPTSDYVYVASVRVDDNVYLVDDVASCSADASGPYAMGVRALGDSIEALVR